MRILIINLDTILSLSDGVKIDMRRGVGFSESRIKRIRSAMSHQYKVIFYSNNEAFAKKGETKRGVAEIFNKVLAEISGQPDTSIQREVDQESKIEYYYNYRKVCLYFSPHDSGFYSIPNPGILYHIALRQQINLQKAMFVGDCHEDATFAHNAGGPYTNFQYNHNFFPKEKEENEENEENEAF